MNKNNLHFLGLFLARHRFFSWVDAGIFCRRLGCDAVFSHRTCRGLPGDSNEYNAVFGKVMIDLRGIELKEKVTRIKIAAVFGRAEVILDKNVPVRIKAGTVFGGVQLPQNVAGAFGSAFYQSQDFDENKNYLLRGFYT